MFERATFGSQFFPIYLVLSIKVSCKMQAENQFPVEEGKALALLTSSEASKDDSRTSTVIIDPRGDLHLGIGISGTGGDPAQSFQVCSRTLARMSPVLERMLYGSFAESNSQRQTDWTIELPEVKAAPFALLAFICHGLCRPREGARLRLPNLIFITTLPITYTLLLRGTFNCT